MKYKRLTEKDSKGDWIVRRVEDYSDYASIFGKDGNYFLIGDVVNRLAELENKIENGTLVELPFAIGTTAEKIFAYLSNNIKRTRDYRNNGTLFFVSDYDMAHMKEQIKIEFGIEL